MNALAIDSDVPKSRLCAVLGQPRHRCYPDQRQRTGRRPRRSQPRRLSEDQRQAVLDVLHSPEYCDASPRQVYAHLLSQGIVLASVSTIYRLLRQLGESAGRRLQRPAQHHVKPQLCATAANQVWTWDITKLPTLSRGVYLNLYLILDLFSRFVVGWMISRKENAGLAKHLFTRVLASRAIEARTLTVHQDRGAPMTAHLFTDLLASMGVERSHSRPRTSNDNAFSEAQFKTLKYAPNYPGRFADIEQARTWTRQFVDYYNHHRPHEGIALYTPADVFTGRVDELVQIRQAALNQHYAKHPERYVNGPPKAKRPPAEVHINPDLSVPADQLLETAGAFKLDPEPVETNTPVTC
jgi:putative transposase